MKNINFILGGARSGKSRFALELGYRFDCRQESRKVFLATAQPSDEEMVARIERHKRDRGEDWLSIEVPIKLTETLQSLEKKTDIVVIDCLTFWINNLLMTTKDSEKIISEIETLITTIQKIDLNIIAVSNEVGLGVVPDNPLSRNFRDLAGLLHQQWASVSDEVYWMVIPPKLTGV